jgi:hypothetical protein
VVRVFAVYFKQPNSCLKLKEPVRVLESIESSSIADRANIIALRLAWKTRTQNFLGLLWRCTAVC